MQQFGVAWCNSSRSLQIQLGRRIAKSLARFIVQFHAVPLFEALFRQLAPSASVTVMSSTRGAPVGRDDRPR